MIFNLKLFNVMLLSSLIISHDARLSERRILWLLITLIIVHLACQSSDSLISSCLLVEQKRKQKQKRKRTNYEAIIRLYRQ